MTPSTVFKGTFFTYCKFHLKVTTYHGDVHILKRCTMVMAVFQKYVCYTLNGKQQ